MSVFINDVNDFIAPSQACVNPFVLESKSTAGDGNPGKVSIQTDFSVSEFETPAAVPNIIRATGSASNAIAKVSLNDCLACSGCVTSAETILIEEQSYDKLLDIIHEGTKIVVVCISPQTVASFAEFSQLSNEEVFLRLAGALKACGVYYVLDSASAGDVSLVEAKNEFVRRYKQNLGNCSVGASSSGSSSGRRQQKASAPATTALSSTRINVIKDEKSAQKHLYASNVPPSESSTAVMEEACVGEAKLSESMPMFISACPGWVCYAEKTHPHALPYLSTVKSAQQILGSLLKRKLKNDIQNNASRPQADVYVVSVQPCFDKKLEASRKDFYHDDLDCAEVDLVLSTTELWNMLESMSERFGATSTTSNEHPTAMDIEGTAAVVGEGREVNDGSQNGAPERKTFTLLQNLPIDKEPTGRDFVERLFRTWSEDGQHLVLAADSSAGSGGYLEYVLRTSAKEILGVDIHPNEPLDYKVGRNADISEVRIESPDASKKLTFARAYGFQNIQSVLLKLKRGKLDYDFIEVMACPSGCVNGGGQLRMGVGASKELPSAAKKRVESVEAVYHQRVYSSPDQSSLVQYLHHHHSQEQEEQLVQNDKQRLYHTRYHVIPKLEVIAPLASKW